METLFLLFAALIISVNAADIQDKLRQSSSGPQSPNINNCENVEIKYSRDPKDFEIISKLLNENSKLCRSNQLQQREVSNLREQVGRLSCRLSTRAINENDSTALEASQILENAGLLGGAKVDSILKPSYEKLFREYLANDKKQQKLKYRLAELAYERASALKMQFKFEAAKELYEKAVELNPNNIDYQIGIASNYYYLGDPHAALSILKKSEPLVLESEPQSKSKFYYCIGWLYQCLGEIDTAFQYLHSKAIDSVVAGNKDSTIAENYKNIGLAWCLKDDYNKAIDYFNRALDIDTLVYGKKSRSVSDIYCRLGAAWSAIEKYDRAIGYFSLALEIDSTIYGKNHPAIAATYFGLAEAWDSKGDHDKAINYFSLCLAIDTVVFGKKHPDIARIYSSLGYALYSKGETDKSIEYYSSSLAIDTVIFGKNHPNVVRGFNDLGLAWDLKGEYCRAINSFEQGIQCGLNIWNEGYPDIKDMRNNLEMSKKKNQLNKLAHPCAQENVRHEKQKERAAADKIH